MNSAGSQFHGLSRKKIAELKRKAEKKEKNKAYYEKNCESLIENTKERRRQSREADLRSQTRALIKEAQKRIKAKEIRAKKRAVEQEKRTKVREQTRERVRRHCEKAKESNSLTTDESPGFQNRTSKKCGTDKVQHALPATPRKKAQILKTVIESPRTRKILEEEGLVKTPEEENQTKALKALAEDVNEGLQHVKVPMN